jgi:putative inorganic carbon (HCO3(-)) transporter
MEKVVAGFFWSGILVSVFELLAFIYAAGIGRPGLVDAPVVVLYFSPNATGLFLGPLLAMAAALILFGYRAERIRAVFFAAWALPAFILSFSRGAWLGLLAALLFLAWQHRARFALLGAVAAAALSSLLLPAVRLRIEHVLNPTDPLNSVNLRGNLWRAALQMQLDPRNALLGTGLSGFKEAIKPYRDFAGYSEDLIYPHDIFLNFWTETGLLGLVAFAWLAVDWTRRSWGTLRARGALRPYYLGVAAASITILVHGLIDVPFFKNDLAFLTLSLVGLQVAAMRQQAAGVGLPPSGAEA